VPGTSNEFNWTYRLSASIEESEKDVDLVKAVEEFYRVKTAGKNERVSCYWRGVAPQVYEKTIEKRVIWYRR
jgi:hypothetical protein